MNPLAVWLDDFSLAALPGVEGALAQASAMVMRSFARTPNPATVAQLGAYRQVAAVGGRDLNDLVSRLERATATLQVGIIGVLPKDAREPGFLHGPGVVDVIPAGFPDAAARIVLMSEVPIISGRPGAGRGRPAAASPGKREPAPLLEAASARLEPAGEGRPLAIASSTGGAWVVADLLRAMDRGQAGPVLLAQHMDADFVPFFAQWLLDGVGWPTTLVSGPTRLEPGCIYLASGGQDLCVMPGGRAASAAAPVSHFVPNADRLFASCAEAFGASAVGIVLSGMGSDGARGLAEIVRRGGQGLCQQPSTAIVPSMPEAALSAAKGAVAMPPGLMAVWLAPGRLLSSS
ncbi:MAG: CheB methylesterase domain-containing protein [Myxococcaceae bacterium]